MTTSSVSVATGICVNSTPAGDKVRIQTRGGYAISYRYELVVVQRVDDVN